MKRYVMSMSYGKFYLHGSGFVGSQVMCELWEVVI